MRHASSGARMEPGQDRTGADADGDQDILQVRPSAAVDEERPRHVAGMRLQTMLHGHESPAPRVGLLRGAVAGSGQESIQRSTSRNRERSKPNIIEDRLRELGRWGDEYWIGDEWEWRLGD